MAREPYWPRPVAIGWGECGGRRKYIPVGSELDILSRTPATLPPSDGDYRRTFPISFEFYGDDRAEISHKIDIETLGGPHCVSRCQASEL